MPCSGAGGRGSTGACSIHQRLPNGAERDKRSRDAAVRGALISSNRLLSPCHGNADTSPMFPPLPFMKRSTCWFDKVLCLSLGPCALRCARIPVTRYRFRRSALSSGRCYTVMPCCRRMRSHYGEPSTSLYQRTILWGGAVRVRGFHPNGHSPPNGHCIPLDLHTPGIERNFDTGRG